MNELSVGAFPESTNDSFGQAILSTRIRAREALNNLLRYEPITKLLARVLTGIIAEEKYKLFLEASVPELFVTTNRRKQLRFVGQEINPHVSTRLVKVNNKISFALKKRWREWASDVRADVTARTWGGLPAALRFFPDEHEHCVIICATSVVGTLLWNSAASPEMRRSVG